MREIALSVLGLIFAVMGCVFILIAFTLDLDWQKFFAALSIGVLCLIGFTIAIGFLKEK